MIFHAGPTNSGKTYQAIQRYLAAKSGVYCGPLKLLAHEIFEKSNSAVCVPSSTLIHGSAVDTSLDFINGSERGSRDTVVDEVMFFHVKGKGSRLKMPLVCGCLQGVPCDLVTGEERIFMDPDGRAAAHVACTIEMCSVTTPCV